MKNIKKILSVCFCLALGSSIIACGAELNPNTQSNIQNALEVKQSEFKKCYESALERDREIKGDMNLQLEFSSTQKTPEKVAVKNSDIKDGDMVNCVKKAAGGISLSEVTNVPVESTNQITFEFE